MLQSLLQQSFGRFCSATAKFLFFKKLRERTIVIMVILCVSLSLADKANAQYNLNLNIDVDKLADTMWAPVFKDLVEGNLYNRDYGKVYRYCYTEIYDKKQGTPAAIAYYYMGACLELGLGTNEVNRYKAKAHYEKGASMGNQECKKRLQSINSKGYWGASKENRDAFARMHGRPCVPSPTSPTSPTPPIGRPAPRPDNGVTCGGCRGTGRCTYCGGTGRVVVDAGLYVAYDAYVYKNCEVCHGTGKCGVCHGSGKIY